MSNSEPANDNPRSDEIRRAVEAILMVAIDPVPANLLAQLLEVSTRTVESECEALAAEFEAEGRGFVLSRVAGGYRFQSHPEQAPWVERFVLEGQSSRLTAAALETLAIVAYKQPVSRAQVSAIRGVDVDGVVRTLQQRGYIDEVSRDPGPGNAILFGTTQEFLERMGLDAQTTYLRWASSSPGRRWSRRSKGVCGPILRYLLWNLSMGLHRIHRGADQ